MTKAIRKDTSRFSGECSPETSTSASLSLGFVPIRQDAQDEKSPIDRVRAHRSFVHRRAVLLDRVARWPDGDTGAVWHENGDTASMVLDLGTGDVSVTVNGELLFEVTDAAKFDGWSERHYENMLAYTLMFSVIESPALALKSPRHGAPAVSLGPCQAHAERRYFWGYIGRRQGRYPSVSD